MNDESLEIELQKALKAVEDAKASKVSWIVWIVLLGLLFGAWYTGQHARESYELGYSAGVLSTDEGREAARRKLLEDRARFVCDSNGRNCRNR